MSTEIACFLSLYRRCDLNSTDVFQGQTLFLTERYYLGDECNEDYDYDVVEATLIYFLIDAQGSVQWVSFMQSDLESDLPIFGIVHPGRLIR